MRSAAVAARRCAACICGLLLVLTAGCRSEEQQVIDPKDLKKIELGEVVRLSGLLKKPAETVCVLTPYQDRLDETELLGRRINAHLAAAKHTASEGHWALVLLNGDTVTVQTVRVGPGLRIVPHHEGVPKNFRPAECANVALALVTKVEFIVEPVLIFGEER